MAAKALLAVQKLILRSARSPLRPLWRLVYRALESAGAAYLARGAPGAAVYARGSASNSPDFLPGLSDVDLVLVLAEHPGGAEAAMQRSRRRWERLSSRVPAIAKALDHPRIHEETELRAIAGASVLDYGLQADPPPDNMFLGRRASYDTQRALKRPGLYGEFDGWRHLHGPGRLPRPPQRGRAQQQAAAWLEVVYMWRLAVGACLRGDPPRSADVCLKAVAEIARVWLWLAHGERPADRRDALERALRLMPEEERGLSRALALRRDLPTCPEPPWAELLPVTLRIAARVAALLDGEDEQACVRLAGQAEDPSLQPLLDWHVLCDPVAAEERFFVAEGDPGDPAALRALARDHPGSPYPALFGHGLMVLPSHDLVVSWRSTVQCPVSDPVSFALAAGSPQALFSGLAGWRADDFAARAVTEHRAWLQAPAGSWRGSPEDGGTRAFELFLTAARASLFWSSLRDGDPELCLTVEEICRRLPEPVATDALAAHTELISGAAEPDDSMLGALRDVVEALPAYASPSASMRSSTAGRSATT